MNKVAQALDLQAVFGFFGPSDRVATNRHGWDLRITVLANAFAWLKDLANVAMPLEHLHVARRR